MAYFYERSYYQSIAHLLTAGDIYSRVVSNEEWVGIKVGLEDGSTVMWTNGADPKGWVWTTVDREGNQHVGRTDLEIGCPEEEAARFIATFPYESAPERTTAD